MISPYDDFLICYHNKTLTLSEIFQYIDLLKLDQFENFLFENQLNFSFLNDNKNSISNQITLYLEHFNYLKVLANYGLSFDSLSKLDIIRFKSLFDYVLENNLANLNIFKDPEVLANDHLFSSCLSNLNYAQFKNLIFIYNINIFQTYTFDKPSSQQEKNNVSPKIDICQTHAFANSSFQEEKHSFSPKIYNNDKINTVQTRAFSNSSFQEEKNDTYPKICNLLAFVKDDEIINYLLEEGLDINQNFQNGHINSHLLKKHFDKLNLELFKDQVIYRIFNELDFRHLSMEKCQQIERRLRLIDHPDLTIYGKFLSLYLISFDSPYKSVAYFNKIVEEILQKYLLNEKISIDFILAEFSPFIINEFHYCVEFGKINYYLKKIMQLYPLDFSSCQHFFKKYLDYLDSEYTRHYHYHHDSYKILYILYKINYSDLENYLKLLHLAFSKYDTKLEYDDFYRLIISAFDNDYNYDIFKNKLRELA